MVLIILGLDDCWQYEIFTDASTLGWGATLFKAGRITPKDWRSLGQTGEVSTYQLSRVASNSLCLISFSSYYL